MLTFPWFRLRVFAYMAFITTLALLPAACPVIPAVGQGHIHPTETITGATARFYETWNRPDQPAVSCCNLQDCYATPSRHRGNHVQAIHRESGEWINVPPEKIELNRDSPDGLSHLCARPDKHVYCFKEGGGT
jgi:hypothetical protein